MKNLIYILLIFIGFGCNSTIQKNDVRNSLCENKAELIKGRYDHPLIDEVIFSLGKDSIIELLNSSDGNQVGLVINF